MTEHTAWRPMQLEESRVIRAIVSAAGIGHGDALIEGLNGALVANSTPWILDVKVTDTGAGSDLPDGPFPARAFVPSNAPTKARSSSGSPRGTCPDLNTRG